MKRLLILVAAALLASCSAPKYTYNFGHYNYQAGKKTSPVTETAVIAGPEKIQPELLTASAGNEIIMKQNVETLTEVIVPKKTYTEMTRVEKKEVKKEIRKIVKAEKKSVKSAQAAKGMDHDLKLAAIFGAVGIVALIISGNVFYIIGGIALIIGVVFFVKWLINQ